VNHPPFEEALASALHEAGLSVSPTEVAQLRRYWNVLQRWNDRINLTSLPLDTASAATMSRLFVEPAIGASMIEDRPMSCFDLGSGGGSPAIPLNVFRPQMQLTMVESKERKSAFLREAVREVGLDAEVLTTRIEDLQQLESTDLVTIRAVKLDGSLLSLVHGQLKQGGRLLVFGAKEIPPLFRPLEYRQLPSGSFLTLLARST
jgi:16S rRNA (guanine527-N7)-methyltransferase